MEMCDSMTEEELQDFAVTSHEQMPDGLVDND